MLAEKKPLSLEEIEDQAVLELPERELLQITQQTGDLSQTATGGLIAANVGVQLNACVICVGRVG